MRLGELNGLSAEAAATEFLRCCGSRGWAQMMSARRPFSSPEQMTDAADQIWQTLDRADWLEAFDAHPRIGETSAAIQSRLGSAPWATAEQSGMNAASVDVRTRLGRGNREYEARFGYIFIVCATGRSAGDILAMLERRLANQPEQELRIAAEEQRKITRLRLEKLLT